MTNRERIKLAFGDLKAPDGLAEEIIQKAQSRRVLTTRRPYRVALVAAAVFVMLAATALAVSPGLREAVFGRPAVVDVPERELEFIDRNYKDFYGSQEPDTQRIESLINAHSVSDGLKAYIAAHEGISQPDMWFGPFPDDYWEKTLEELGEMELMTHFYSLRFSSLDEAAGFFGIWLPQNPLLTKLARWETDADGDYEPGVRGGMDVNKEKTAAMVCLVTRFDLGDGNWTDLVLKFMCDNQAAEPMKCQYYGYDDAEDYDSQPSGVKALIVNHDETGDAIFVINDIAYSLDLRLQSDGDPAAILKEIIDAFE